MEETKKDYEKNLKLFIAWLAETQKDITLVLSDLALGKEEEIPSEPSIKLFKQYKQQVSD